MNPDPTNDTIAAVATSPGEGGVAIIRISGPTALVAADGMFRCPGLRPSERPSHTVTHGRVVDAEGVEIDEALLLVFRAPRSYTREDVVEIQGHGGAACARRILRRALECGARLASPGEFTKRAFLHGRLDLLQAEAVLDLIRARSDRAGAAAVEQLEGGLSRSFNSLYDDVLSVAARLEATLDFPEDDLPTGLLDAIGEELKSVLAKVDALLATWDEGHWLRDGALVVISGKPNAGKSTLMNALLGRNRAIVSATPGTTRDSLEENISLAGIPLRLVDTAGLRDAGDEIEREGIERAREYMRKADLHLHVADGSLPADGEDLQMLARLSPDRTLLLLNKRDLGCAFLPPPGVATIPMTLSRGEGVDLLRARMIQMLGTQADLSARPHAVIGERHRQALLSVRADLAQAHELVMHGGQTALVPAASHLRSVLGEIGSVTGREFHESLLDAIFGRFCIGK